MSINLIQNFLYETDELDSFGKVLDTIVRVMYKENPSKYAQMFVYKEKPSKYAQMFVTQRKDPMFRDGKWDNEEDNSKPKFMHVCTIGEYSGNIKEEDDKFDKYAKLVKKVMEHVKNADSKKFLEECGNGHNSFFNEMDGSIGIGYRITERPTGGWKNLDISLCHIYYGK